jgi:hypothetical protein
VRPETVFEKLVKAFELGVGDGLVDAQEAILDRRVLEHDDSEHLTRRVVMKRSLRSRRLSVGDRKTTAGAPLRSERSLGPSRDVRVGLRSASHSWSIGVAFRQPSNPHQRVDEESERGFGRNASRGREAGRGSPGPRGSARTFRMVAGDSENPYFFLSVRLPTGSPEAMNSVTTAYRTERARLESGFTASFWPSAKTNVKCARGRHVGKKPPS